MEKIRKIQQLEIIIYTILWAVIFMMTILLTYHDGVHWNRILLEWSRLLPFLFIFLLNNSLLAPLLLIRKKYGWYVLSLIGAFVLVVLLRHFATTFDPLLTRQPPIPERPPFRPPLTREKQFLVMAFNNVSISLLIVGFNAGIKLLLRNIGNEHLQSQAQQQQLKTELAFLKYQISPHFFMNTLNNIHALVDIDPKDAKDAIIKLSGLMRYLLYDADQEGRSSLKKEIRFIEDYIELMRLRYDPSLLKVHFEYPEVSDDQTIPPLLFLSFIENAFKHGVVQGEKSAIDIQLTLEGNRLNFTAKNKLGKRFQANKESSGVGLENVKKRLQLIYGKNYDLQIIEQAPDFEVRLKIPMT